MSTLENIPNMTDSSSSPDPMTDPRRFLNRELQWLEFNERVLRQAMDPCLPLLERVRFLSIFSSNLDEFFMKRVGGLRRQLDAGIGVVFYEDISPAALLAAIRERVIPMMAAQSRCFRDDIVPALREIGIDLAAYADLTDDERGEVDAWYRRQVFPILTPLAVDHGHRFPFISNLSVSLGILLRRPGTDEHLFARVKVPEVVEQWHRVGRGSRFVALDDVIRNNLDDLFPGMEIAQVLPFRVTRNADVEHDYEDAEDLMMQIQMELRERRFAPVVRLRIERSPDPAILDFLREELELTPDDIYQTDRFVNYRNLSEIADLDLPEHRFAPWTPVTPPRLVDDEKDMFSVIREGDLLVHHPYESFEASVERFIKEAASDPNVICIKQALYRTSGDSVFVRELMRAAEHGKQVAVLVELRARFDEERNILWAGKLEDAGVHVAYGVVGLKTHTKIALVIRREHDGIRCYGHVGTGNYHSRTARLYEDIGLFTCNPAVTEDLINLFNFITGRSLQQDYNKLLIAPYMMKTRFIEMIEREISHARAGRGGRIIAKMNQLQDREMIDALYRASAAGVSIDLIVRGFCTLRPGVPGLSDNIRLCSIIGRFLEHSRIYYFADGEGDPLKGEYFIGSADWMYRNLHARVEAVTPIEEPALRSRLWEILRAELADRRQCWDMDGDGRYTLRTPPAEDRAESEREHAASTPFIDEARALGTHEALMRRALRGMPGAGTME